MAHVMCQVLAHPSRITFRWSDANKHFEPYYLDGEALRRFWAAAGAAREQLGKLSRGDSALELARAGRQLHDLIFATEGPSAGLTREIRDWLAELHGKNRIKSLEITGDTIGLVPWQAVYEQPVEPGQFQQPAESALLPFWGVRYALGVTHRVNPLRQAGPLMQPELLLAMDGEVRAAISPDQRERLTQLASSKSLTVLETQHALAAALKNSAPDVLFLLCGVDASGLRLDGTALPVDRLREWLSGSDSAQIPWQNLLVVLVPSGDAGVNWLRVRRDLFGLGLAGLIAPEQPVAAEVAAQFAQEFAARFLGGKTVGNSLQSAVAALAGVGLSFAGCCPPNVALSLAGGNLENIRGADERAEAEENTAEEYPMPSEPYHPLVPLDREDRALLVGRENDIAQFAAVVDAPGVRLALLHGRSGVGKSSLLRAGVVPYLEEEAVGYQPLLDRSEGGESEQAERACPMLTIRATNDLLGQLAPALAAFAARPFSFATPTGRKVTVDLPALLNLAIASCQLPVAGEEVSKSSALTTALYSSLRQDRALLGRLLLAFSEKLPAEPLLVIEQAEEFFSLTRTVEDQQIRQHALAMLLALAEAPGHSRVILSLTTAYLGRLTARLRPSVGQTFLSAGVGQTSTSGGKQECLPHEMPVLGEYLLAALNVSQLAEVITRPTEAELIAGAAEIPGDKYRFQFVEELPQRIAREAIQAVNAGREEALPLVQAICALLYLRIGGRENRTVTAEDLKKIGGVDGGVARYAEQLVNSIARPTERKSLWSLLEGMFARQPDGSLTRTLLPESELAPRWSGSTPFAALVETASSPQVGLLDERLAVTALGEQSVVSLGHDVLAPILAERQHQTKMRHYGRARITDTLWVCIPLMLLLLMASYFFLVLPKNRMLDDQEQRVKEFVQNVKKKLLDAEQDKKAVLKLLYPAQVEQARLAWKQGDILRLQQIMAGLQPSPEERKSFEWRFLAKQAQGSPYTLAGHEGTVTAVAVDADGKLLLTASVDGTVRAWDLNAKGKDKGLPIQLPGQKLGQPALRPHDGPLQTLALQPSGQLFATAAADGSIKTWEIEVAEKGKTAHVKERQQLTGVGKGVTALAFANDKTLISAGADHVVRLWDVETGKQKQELKEHACPVTAVAVALDSQSFASSDDKQIIVWNMKKGKIQQSINTGASALAISPNGEHLAAALVSRDVGETIVKFWDPRDGSEAKNVLKIITPVMAMSFGADQGTLLTAGKDRGITAWNLGKVFLEGMNGIGQPKLSSSEKIDHACKGHIGWVGCLAVDHIGKRLFSGSHDSLVKVWDLSPPPSVIQGYSGALYAVAISPDRNLIASSDETGHVLLWDPKTGKEIGALDGKCGTPVPGEKDHRLAKHDAQVRSLAFAQLDKQLLLASGSDKTKGKPGRVILWDAKTRELFGEFTGHTGGITCIAISDDGKLLAAASDDGTVRIWDLVQSKTAEGFGEFDSLRAANFMGLLGTPTGHSPLLASPVLLPTKGKVKFVFTRHQGPVRSVAFYPKTHLLASGGDDGRVYVWWGENGAAYLDQFNDLPPETIASFEKEMQHAGAVTNLVFLPYDAGRVLASGGTDGVIKLWDLNRATQLSTLAGQNPITGLAGSKESFTLFSASQDHRVKLWNIPTGTEIFNFDDHLGPVHGIALSADLNTLVSVGADGFIRIYHAGP